MQSKTDEELAILYQGGEDEAFDLLYSRYKYMIKACAHSFFLAWGDDDDLLQEGVIGFLKATKSYKNDCCSSFSSYAYTCIHRSILSAIKNANSKKNQPLNTCISISERLPDEISSLKDPEEEVISRETEAELVKKIKEGLSSFEVNVLSLYLDGLSYTEIGEKLSKTAKSIDNALQRIKRKISNLLAKRRK